MSRWLGDTPVRPLCAADAAKHMLRDFAVSGVDEDLERLRGAWMKPPTPPSSDDDDFAMLAPARLRSSSGSRRPAYFERQQWQGPLDPPQQPNLLNVSRRLASGSGRVRSGALDYQSEHRLETLANLRRLASSGAATPQSMPLALHDLPRLCSRAARAGSMPTQAPTAVEREARRNGVHASRQDGEASMNWDEWERRWAEELRAFASAAKEQKTLALAFAAERAPLRSSSMNWFEQGRREQGAGSREQGEYASRVPPRWQPGYPQADTTKATPRPDPDYPHAMPPRDPKSSSDSDGDSRQPPPPWQQQQQQQRQWQRWQQQQQRQQQQEWQQQQQRRQQPCGGRAQPPPPLKPSITPSATPSLSRFASWAEYNAAFEAFENRRLRQDSLEAISVADVPFPPTNDPAGALHASHQHPNPPPGPQHLTPPPSPNA